MELPVTASARPQPSAQSRPRPAAPTAPRLAPSLAAQLRHTARCVLAVEQGRSLSEVMPLVSAELRPGVQALTFHVLRQLGTARAVVGQLVQRKPGALRNGAPFADLPNPLRLLKRGLRRHSNGDRIMTQVLAAVPIALLTRCW